MNEEYDIFAMDFDNDYSKLDIASLRKYHKVKSIRIPWLLKIMIININKLSPKISLFILGLYIKNYVFNFNQFCENSIILLNDNVIGKLASDIVNEYNKHNIMIIRNSFNDREFILNRPHIYFFTFDFNDSKRLNINHYDQYCSGYDYILKNKGRDKVYDFYFLGLNKGRKKYVDKIYEKIKKYKNLIILKEKGTITKKLLNLVYPIKSIRMLPYRENLDFLLQSEVIIDITKDGQTGLTMRVIEALLSDKKIITNNESVREYPFYDENNIFIIDDFDSLSEKQIECFLSMEYIIVSDELKKNYEPGYILNNIINSVMENKWNRGNENNFN
ncbi:hypothetical protein [Klebsiella sp. BIGb0407]|uniref:hypothetical protein n=1 Tax=Klebsiella sp. BIGb0407 TaxID=2940603 RepID=UPI0021689D01|nr:hypothetical protein [Klebsiella sp. BIGb0407]MCS3430537.1 1,5-rhamnosyltransferase [Klebsiella sp. BIGb0407]